MINLKLLIFIILIFESTNGNEDELFGDKSIIRKLRNELGSFKSEIKFIDHANDTIDLNEQYTFKYKNGELLKFDQLKYIYLDDFDELHFVGLKDLKYCISYDKLKSIDRIQWNLQKYSPDQLIKIPSDFRLMGPSHFLFSLIDNYDQNDENIKCENLNKEKTEMRCDIVFENSAKIEYYFKDDNQLKMYPIKIKTFEKESNNDTELKLYSEIEYTKFDYSFNGDYYNVSVNLPVGLGCLREDYQNKYPKIETDFSKRFKLEYDFEFDYLNLTNKDNDTFLKRKYTGKWFMDDEYKFNIIDSIDEETNQHLRTYYDSDSEIAYDIIDNNKCARYNLKEELNYTLNWFYFQDIILFPELFNIGVTDIKDDKEEIINSVYSYLGEHKLDNDDEMTYKTFEERVYFHLNNNSYAKDMKRRKNLNNIESEDLIVTHYYNPSSNKIPEFIEIRIIEKDGRLIGKIKIKINRYSLISAENFNEEINLTNCFKDLNSIDYRELNVQFQDNHNSIKLFSENYVKYEFRKLISKHSNSISPLRIDDIKLEINNNLINMTTRLIDPLDSLQYFNRSDGLELDEKGASKNKLLIYDIQNLTNEELCARSCIEKFRCSSYSFKKEDTNTICNIWMAEFSLRDGPDETVWEKLKIKQALNSTLGKRFSKFILKEHQSVDNLLYYIKELIDKNEFDLNLKTIDHDIKFNYVKHDVEPKKSRNIN